MDQIRRRPGSWRVVGTVAAVLMAATACASGSSGGSQGGLAKDQVLRFNINTEPNSFDPGQQQYTYEAAVGRQAWESLLKPKQDLSDVEPATAESYKVSDDGQTYTFKIRKNAKYNDGQPVKAQDFVYAWQRLIDPRLAAPYNDYYVPAIKGAEDAAGLDPKKDAGRIDEALKAMGLSAPDDSTFVVKLTAPSPYFKWIATLWNGAPIRKDVVDKQGADKWATTPAGLVGNGPFKVTEIASKDHVTLEPNSFYWGGKPTISKITLFEISDDNADFAKYQNGEEDLASVPLANTDLARKDPKLSKELKEVPRLRVDWIQFNNTKPPFDNLKVRLAFAQAVDRELMANSVYKGRAIPSPTFIPKGMPGYKPELGDPQKFDAAKAKAALQESGVSNISVKFLVRNTTTNKQIAEFIQDQIQKNLPGVKIELEVVDSKTVTPRLRKKDFQMYVGGWLADYPDEQNWFDLFITGSGNQFSGYSNKQYDDLVKKADQEVKDSAKRQQLYDQAHAIIIKEVAGAFLVQSKSLSVRKPYLQGIQDTPIDEWPGCYFSTKISIGQH